MMLNFPMLHEDPGFDVITEDEFLSSPENYVQEDEVDFARCVWDGYKMVTEEEYEAELASGALALA